MLNSSIPSKMEYKVRLLQNIVKQTVKILPNVSPSTVINQLQPVRVVLPIGTVDLSTFNMTFNAWTDHNGNAVGGAGGYAQCRYLPRNTASLIENLEVIINGTSRVNIPNYNYIYNILHDFQQSGDGLNRRNIGENSDPSCKYFYQDVDIAGAVVNNVLCAKKGYPVGLLNPTLNGVAQAPSATLNDFDVYSVRSWLSIFDGSTKIIDTSIYGQIEVIITFTKAAATMLGHVNTVPITPLPNTGITGLVPLAGLAAPFATLAALNAATVAAADAVTVVSVNNDAGIDIVAGAAIGAGANTASQGNSFHISNLSFTIVRYDMPPEFYQSQANILAAGQSYELYFKNYTIFTGNPTPCNSKNQTMRIALSSSSVDYIIGTFRAANYDDNVDATNQVVLSSISQEYMGQFGQDSCTFDNQLKSGKQILFNNSKYFVRNGESISQTQWMLGNTTLLQRTPIDTYEAMLQHFDIQNDNKGGLYPAIKSLYHFNKTFYADILSLNVSGENPQLFNVSGRNSEELPLNITWTTTSTTNAPYDNQIITVNGGNPDSCLPVMIVVSTPHLQVSSGRRIIYIP